MDVPGIPRHDLTIDGLQGFNFREFPVDILVFFIFCKYYLLIHPLPLLSHSDLGEPEGVQEEEGREYFFTASRRRRGSSSIHDF